MSEETREILTTFGLDLSFFQNSGIDLTVFEMLPQDLKIEQLQTFLY